MYNCYNEAVRYLNKKYNGKESKIVGDKTINIVTPDDLTIKLLLSQYYFGIQAKKELYFKLVYMGVMEDKENKT